MTKTLSYAGTLVVTACWCGIHMAIPSELMRVAKHKGIAVWCPVGHEWVVKETEADRLKRELRWAEDAAASERARADQIEASLRTTRGHVTRLRRRAIAGVCAFCHRHFANVERHVASKHGDEQP